MLVRGEPERALVHFGDFAESGLELAPGFVLDTTILNECHEVVPAILTNVPTKVIDVAVEGVGACRFEGVAEEFFNLSLINVETHSVYGIFQASVLAARKAYEHRGA